MRKSTIVIDREIEKIQEIRVIQALAESGYSIVISNEQKKNLQFIVKHFPKKFNTGYKDGLFFSELIAINHSEPTTSIGSLIRPLIFPHYFCYRLKSEWKEKRRVRFSFAGLMSAERKRVIELWLNKHRVQKKKLELPDESGTTFRAKRKILALLGKGIYWRHKDTYIWLSDRGRRFPIKAWDREYYDNLCQSQFVLCPSGDFIWTYRFFEAILCGAIPVIEENCPLYENYRFYYMQDNRENFTWSCEDAEYNYNLCLKNMTLPINLLRNEIRKYSLV
ncbi:exostosin domain-containing protein [Salinimicrobium sediminilitoris]|uniref:exostosin domain-containing protein n=1 Tax=Salinimicrobium sediminilitoris TaxID=2876715 RepID=UPI001E60E9D8|nr:exostosin family protein [Salinimicrobium sediminilitoris]MCC8358459.1 glycosyltransferase family 47 protein [Salinimicrobium sediminilitoris]